MAERKLSPNIPLIPARPFSATSSPSNGESEKICDKDKSLPRRMQSLPSLRTGFNIDQVTEPVAVPFHWEQIPGRRKTNSGRDHPSPGMASVTAMHPPGRSLTAGKQPIAESKIRPSNKASFHDNMVKIDNGREVKAKTRGVDDGVYSDAVEIDTLSQTESVSMTCSVGGLSGFDTTPTMKQGSNFSTDTQTRDFMMSRFLPAAEAMAWQPPLFNSRKQTTIGERQRELTKQFNVEKKHFLNQSPSNVPLHYPEYKEGEEETEEKNKGESDTVDISTKGCGFFPRLCFKNSVSILGPIEGMKIQNKFLLHSSSDLDKSCKESHLKPHCQAVKKVWDAVCSKNLGSASGSPDIREVRNKFSHSSRFNYSGELQRTGRSSPFRSSRCSGVSPCRSRMSQHLLHGAKFPVFSKESADGEPLRSQSAGRASRILQQVPQERKVIIPASHIVEKILHIDTVNSKVSGSVESKFRTLADLSPVRGQKNRSKEFKLEQEHNSKENSSDQRKNKFNGNPNIKSDSTGDGNGAGCFTSPVPPPLPKSPSDSWLWRTVPSISFRNSFPYSSYDTQSRAKRQDCDTSFPQSLSGRQ